MANNAVCKVCGSGYRICGHCPASASLSFFPWRRIVDTSNCYAIWLAVCGYSNKQISKEKAKEELNKVDLSVMKLDTFDTDIKNLINEIMASEPEKAPVAKKQRKTVNKIKEDNEATIEAKE